ncbi:Uncharacterized protein JG29_16340 [Bombilactobacillus mellis]|uniref:Uncharacterized protein n=1 Tax=Bombilactobacillus mellis TaxID=1218508 RepID=A0A0F4KSC5_9LACO|nr:RusA family crossover junction endodeoxyribonuclease [Bombilactobacillus mellis]KJY48116.1 Uncharacterized protein JG29_16340 [Bombilactobacillus mellis]
MSEWQAVIPFAPQATPRPQFKFVKNSGSQGKVITYYPTKYTEYMQSVKDYLLQHQLYNNDFYQTIQNPYGVLMEVIFYLKIPQHQKTVKSLMRKTAPDIDNLEKAIMDSIFKDLDIRDSRIVGIKSLKLNEKNFPRTEVHLIGVDGDE